VAIFIGPEGVFAQQEVDLFEQSGVKAVSLGKRILRMETAAIVAPALILYELGQMEV
jgi:16S rRNA (uracil1498-N3)-methyltransferase